MLKLWYSVPWTVDMAPERFTIIIVIGRTSVGLFSHEMSVVVRGRDGEKRQILNISLQDKPNPQNHSRDIYLQVPYNRIYSSLVLISLIHISQGIFYTGYTQLS